MPETRVTAKQRRKVAERANGRCEYCYSPADFATQTFNIEHIIPRAKGGRTALNNLAFSCAGCNGHKYTKTTWRDSVTEKIVPLYHPRQHEWREHFTWNDDFTLIVGLTPIGRATIAALQLNRESLVNLRRALYTIKEHPPREGKTS